MGKRVLVTGGAGFIGSHLVDRLLAGGHDVRVLDNLEPQVHHGKKPDYLNRKAEFMRGDVRSMGVLEKALEDVEVVFHQAAAVGIGQSMYRIRHYVDVNTCGTAKLLELLAEGGHSVGKLVVASSMSIYGEGAYRCVKHGVVYPGLRSRGQLRRHDWELKCPQCGLNLTPIPTAEDKPLQPTSIYAVTKRDQEEMCLSVGQAYGIPTVALRYFNVYGPRQALSNPYTGVAAIFSSKIKNNNRPIIFEDGLQARDFVYVTDVAEANLLAMRKRSADYKSFNVGSGGRVTILQVAESLARLYRRDIRPLVTGKYRAGDVRYCFGSIERIKRFGFKPRVSFEEGMKRLVLWGGTQEARDLSEKASRELAERNLVER